MTDFVDPLQEPYRQDRAAGTPLDPDAQQAYDEHVEAERREAEEAAHPHPDPDADDGTEVTSASEGDALDPTTPVDNLE